MDFQDYINKLYVEISSLTDAFCNGCEKCRTNEEAYEFLDNYYRENIYAWLDFLDTNENGEIEDETTLIAERYMFSMIERVITAPEHSWLNKKSVRFFRYFAMKMNSILWTSEEERLGWEEENMLLGI